MYRLSTRVDINSRKITPFQTFQNALSMYRTSNEHIYACKAKYIDNYVGTFMQHCIKEVLYLWLCYLCLNFDFHLIFKTHSDMTYYKNPIDISIKEIFFYFVQCRDR